MPSLLLLAACSGQVEPIPPAAFSDLPPPVASAPPPAGAPVAFRMTKLFYGDVDSNGVTSSVAWKDLGHDVDGIASRSADTANHCRLVAGSPRSTQINGTGGIDNSFGENLLPVILTLAGADHTVRANARLAAGELTNLLAIESLGPSADYSGLRVSFAGGSPLGHAPAKDGSDLWPRRAPSIDLGRAYMVSRTLVAGPSAEPVVVALPVIGAVLELPVRRMVVTMNVAADGASATRGILSGVIATEDFVRILTAAAPSMTNNALCEMPELITTAVDMIRQASDILADGTQDASRECDAISFGLGFEATKVGLGEVVPVAPPAVACK